MWMVSLLSVNGDDGKVSPPLPSDCNGGDTELKKCSTLSRSLPYHDRWALFGSLPLFIGSEADRRIYYNRAGRIRLPVRLVTYIFCSLPTLALFACVFLALETDFELATRTHCGVQNLLPSVSVAVGDFHWGNLLWKSAIFTHLPPRICVAFVYAQLFRVPFERCGQQTLRYATCVTNLIELFSLGLLSAVTSEHNHPLHVFAFTTFQVCLHLNLLLIFIFTHHYIGFSSNKCPYRTEFVPGNASVLFHILVIL
ncbi:unnamed protein product [Toxocara canis]|uniref:Post-GPI attachment to proteins factor 2 n=1 Tax=Toxocara canis TaxID=6265 RepID=A0A183V4Y3_TOXCA|nr:unnamed protein product [Toxocara canis]